jgi:uncharacterized integral membrane protein
MTHGGHTPTGTTDGTPTRSRVDRTRTVAAFVLGALTVVFAVLNLEQVEVNWIVGVWRTPLIVVILVSVLLGVAIGFIFSRRHRA